SVMNNAMTSLMANQLALGVASNNIANGNDPDYTRQRLVTAPGGSDGGALGMGTGVQVLGVEQIRDSLVNGRLQSETAAQSGADILSSGLSDIEALFNDTTNTGLMQKLTDFFNSFQQLAQDPSSLPNRQQVQVKASSLIDEFHSERS